MFLIKKMIGQSLTLLPCITLMLFLGFTFLAVTRRQRTGKTLVALGLLLILVAGHAPLARHVTRLLEDRYPTFSRTYVTDPSNTVIIVLGGDYYPDDPTLPETSRLGPSSLSRLVEGIRLHRRLPGSRLLLSGGAILSSTPEAETMAIVAVAMGVIEDNLILETSSRDTEEQAHTIQPLVRGKTPILVTSAIHMPRAMALFQNAGLHPIAAPADHRAPEKRRFWWEPFFPSSESLRLWDAALHEYCGILWSEMRDRI